MSSHAAELKAVEDIWGMIHSTPLQTRRLSVTNLAKLLAVAYWDQPHSDPFAEALCVVKEINAAMGGNNSDQSSSDSSPFLPLNLFVEMVLACSSTPNLPPGGDSTSRSTASFRTPSSPFLFFGVDFRNLYSALSAFTQWRHPASASSPSAVATDGDRRGDGRNEEDPHALLYRVGKDLKGGRPFSLDELSLHQLLSALRGAEILECGLTSQAKTNRFGSLAAKPSVSPAAFLFCDPTMVALRTKAATKEKKQLATAAGGSLAALLSLKQDRLSSSLRLHAHLSTDWLLAERASRLYRSSVSNDEALNAIYVYIWDLFGAEEESEEGGEGLHADTQPGSLTNRGGGSGASASSPMTASFANVTPKTLAQFFEGVFLLTSAGCAALGLGEAHVNSMSRYCDPMFIANLVGKLNVCQAISRHEFKRLFGSGGGTTGQSQQPQNGLDGLSLHNLVTLLFYWQLIRPTYRELRQKKQSLFLPTGGGQQPRHGSTLYFPQSKGDGPGGGSHSPSSPSRGGHRSQQQQDVEEFVHNIGNRMLVERKPRTQMKEIPPSQLMKERKTLSRRDRDVGKRVPTYVSGAVPFVPRRHGNSAAEPLWEDLLCREREANIHALQCGTYFLGLSNVLTKELRVDEADMFSQELTEALTAAMMDESGADPNAAGGGDGDDGAGTNLSQGGPANTVPVFPEIVEYLHELMGSIRLCKECTVPSCAQFLSNKVEEAGHHGAQDDKDEAGGGDIDEREVIRQDIKVLEALEAETKESIETGRNKIAQLLGETLSTAAFPSTVDLKLEAPSLPYDLDDVSSKGQYGTADGTPLDAEVEVLIAIANRVDQAQRHLVDLRQREDAAKTLHKTLLKERDEMLEEVNGTKVNIKREYRDKYSAIQSDLDERARAMGGQLSAEKHFKQDRIEVLKAAVSKIQDVDIRLLYEAHDKRMSSLGGKKESLEVQTAKLHRALTDVELSPIGKWDSFASSTSPYAPSPLPASSSKKKKPTAAGGSTPTPTPAPPPRASAIGKSVRYM